MVGEWIEEWMEVRLSCKGQRLGKKSEAGSWTAGGAGLQGCRTAGLQGGGDVTVDYPGQDELLLNLSCRPGSIYSHLSGLAERRETPAARNTSHLEELHNHYHHTNHQPTTHRHTHHPKFREKKKLHIST